MVNSLSFSISVAVLSQYNPNRFATQGLPNRKQRKTRSGIAISQSDAIVVDCAIWMGVCVTLAGRLCASALREQAFYSIENHSARGTARTKSGASQEARLSRF
jgi:hypothetical protein